MESNAPKYRAFINILKEELVPAMGCTEPIALAYCAAKATQTLGCIPQSVVVYASGSIIKNVKSVVVPNTNNMRGIPAAVAAGIVAGKPERKLEVIAEVSKAQQEQIREYLAKTDIVTEHIDNGFVFEIAVKVTSGEHCAYVRIVNYHTNIVEIQKDGEILLSVPIAEETKNGLTDRSCLSIADIFDFAESVDVADIQEILERQIAYNTAISEEGLRGDYGSNIGSVLLDTYGSDNVMVRAKAKAAAGSDARMNGCALPVIINSGSGNQGITSSVPVIEYANELHVSREKLYRALALANLTSIHQKSSIGRLSAFCGVISAGAGAGAGIAYLLGANAEGIAYTVANAIATTGGIICDGAKASCASKIATAVEAGILGYQMHIRQQDFQPNDGIVGLTPEDTISNIGRVGKDGMKSTNKEIIKIMIEK